MILIHYKKFIFSSILADILPKITTQFESLKPSFQKIDRIEDLISRINSDFDILGEPSRHDRCAFEVSDLFNL